MGVKTSSVGMKGGLGFLVLVKAVGVVKAGIKCVRTTTLIMGRAKEKNNIVTVFHADRTSCIFLVFLYQRFAAFVWVSFLYNIPWPFLIHHKTLVGPIKRSTHSSLSFHYGPSLYITRTFYNYYGIITIIARGWNPFFIIVWCHNMGRMKEIDLAATQNHQNFMSVYIAFHPIRGTLRPLDESKCPKTLDTKPKTCPFSISPLHQGMTSTMGQKYNR